VRNQFSPPLIISGRFGSKCQFDTLSVSLVGGVFEVRRQLDKIWHRILRVVTRRYFGLCERANLLKSTREFLIYCSIRTAQPLYWKTNSAWLNRLCCWKAFCIVHLCWDQNGHPKEVCPLWYVSNSFHYSIEYFLPPARLAKATRLMKTNNIVAK